MINLSQVTLCAIDTCPDLAIRAMKICMERCEFGDVVLVTNQQTYAPFRVVYAEGQYSKKWYSDFCIRQMINYINTPFILLVQYDGYIINPECWDDQFLEYDYIGAHWPWFKDDDMTVGNGGFSLRSRKLLETLAEFPGPEDVNEDVYICRKLREELINCGIKFAPLHIANKFSYEREKQEHDTFGFHGIFNFYRHVPEHEIVAMSPLFSKGVVQSKEFQELMYSCFIVGKHKALVALKKRQDEVRG